MVSIGLTSLFALDVFELELTGWQILASLFMHLLPTLFLILTLAIAWKMEKLGGWLFVALGGYFLFIGGFAWGAILVFTVPLWIIGSLYLIHHYKYSRPPSMP